MACPSESSSEMNNQSQVIHVANPTTYNQRRPTKTQSLLEVMTEPLDHLPATTNANINTFWRYMDWWKYEDLITRRALWMSTAKTLDQGEGLHVRLVPMNSAVLQTRRKWIEYARGHFLISCWHESEPENEYMWNRYTETVDSVAVKTSAHRLSKCFTYPRHATLHRVQYTRDPLVILSAPGSFDMTASVLYKSFSFAKDKEVRLICEPDLRIRVTQRTIGSTGDIEEQEGWNPQKHGDPWMLHVDPFVVVAEVRPHPDSDYERMKKKISLLHSQALQGRASQPCVAVGKSDYFTRRSSTGTAPSCVEPCP